ncbi:MAG: organic hydroperoxide resistance protein [Polyangiales bacterium]
MTKSLYTAEATAHGGREGKVNSTNDRLKLDLSMPKELGGPGAAGATNPEELFACGYAACFHSAVKFVAMRQKLDTADSTVTARVSLYPNGVGGFKLGVELSVSLPRLDRETAVKLVETAHQVCPYSNATRNNIDVALTVA